ncbi:hypothetical protein HN51_071211 [Arachis hypogaea]|uniref:alkane hydroxylase MAH1-like n=1 Tax=Arachis ipaensis TaxID=130454 RepID=UPI0007AF7421|nr:alkane hydroxylase MAH1-like [Arachis ipaensis]XP_025656356.1 alkane hydroxylase MAH1 [Arachis hypogaea]
MAIFLYVSIIASSFCYIYYFFHRRLSCKSPLLIDWPILGMLPKLLWNLYRIHDFITDILKQHGRTGEFMGPWFTNMNYLVTSDPMNVHHIKSKSFDNYVKGSEFREIFQVFGLGIFTTDSETWRYHRSLLLSLFKNRKFEMFLEKTTKKKVECSLIPTLEDVRQHEIEVDLQDVFNRFTFDNICSIVLGYDPNCLSIEFPQVACEKAFNEAEESIFYRHVVPKSVWKLLECLQIGQEKKMSEACKVFDQFIYSCTASKREELRKYNKSQRDEAQVDLLSVLMMMREEEEEKGQGQSQSQSQTLLVNDDKFLRDSAFNLFVAGRDTITSALTWFFWLVATNPLVETKILDEIKENFGSNNDEMKHKVLGIEEVKKLVYLHGALCESLRLFPPIPFERKQPIKSDILPSGHHVNPNTMILLSLYAMGRYEEIWGKDCLEFKPERWISEKGGIIHVPSYKFISFNAGPRTCLGKDLSFMQIKMVAASILCNYHIHVVEGHQAIPNHSIVLLMKDGLKVRITKREGF